MSTQQARYHALGSFASLSLVTSGVVGMFLAGTSPTSPPVNPCDVRLTVTASPSGAPSATAVTSVSPSASASASSTTASPSPSTSTSSPPGRLCVRVQPLSGAPVPPGRNARYAVWVWFAGTTTGDALIGIAATPGRLSPIFTVCPWPGTATCPVAASSQPVELVAQVAAPQRHTGTRLVLTATATSPEAASPAAASGSVRVKELPKPASTTTPAASTPAPGGVGATIPLPSLPPATLPPGTPPPGVLASVSPPRLPDPAISPALVLPDVTPAPSPAPPAHPIQAADASAQFPLGQRQSGGQLLGLAVLAAAVTIAIARLSLRKPRPQQDKDTSPASD